MIVAAAMAFCGADPALADTNKQLREVEKRLKAGKSREAELKKRSKALADEMGSIRADLIATAKAVQTHESDMTRLESRLAELADEQRKTRKRLSARRGEFGRVLMALERIARNPPEAMIAHPKPPEDMVRTAMLLRAVAPSIEARADQVRRDLASLNAASRETEERRIELSILSEELKRKRANLRTLFSRKARIQRKLESERKAHARRLKRMAKQARNLRELLSAVNRVEAAIRQQKREQARKEAEAAKKAEQLAKAAPKPKPKPEAKAPPSKTKENMVPAKPQQVASVGAPPKLAPAGPVEPRKFSKARGKLTVPVAGRLIKRYGQATSPGMSQKGMTYRTRAGAQVVAPYDGKVVFAGVFRGYGQLLIIEHTEGYHTLLAGMGRIDSAPGQMVVAGEPVGVMGDGKGKKPTLYVELRRKSQPINPKPWLSRSKGKASG